MNATTVDNDQIDRYLAAVRSELADLPDNERADLLEDLEQHLREVAAEEDGSLEERLGDPVSYAKELRTSVGYQEPPRGFGSIRHAVETSRPVSRARGAWRTVAEHPEFQEFRASAAASRPLWWLARGYSLVLLFGLMLEGSRAARVFPFPRLADSALFGLVLAIGGAAGSVALGRRSEHSRRARLISIVLNILLVVMAFSVASTVRNRAVMSYAGAGPTHYPSPEFVSHDGALTGSDGQVVTNIFPFGADGAPLDGVTLYDQNGRPLDIVIEHDEDGNAIVTSYQLDVDGRPVTHAFPQHQTLRPDHGFDDDPRNWDARGRPAVDPPVLRSGSEEPDPSASPSASEEAAPAEQPRPSAEPTSSDPTATPEGS